MRERDLGGVRERLVVAVAAGPRHDRHRRFEQRVDLVLGEPVEPAERRVRAPLLCADVVVSRQRAALRMVQEASDRRAIEVAAVVEPVVVDEHLGTDEIEEDEPGLELDGGRGNLDDLGPEVTTRVERSLESFGHVGVELHEPEAGRDGNAAKR